jgi:hypothetical protein
MNWKQKAAESIVKHEAPAAAAPSNDQALARALLQNYPNIAARDTAFARSLMDGFTKYGSFTPKQRPHVERLAGLAPAAPVEAPANGVSDKQLAERLGDYLPRLAPRDVNFADSLLAGFKRYGSFTPKQRPHVERLVAQFHTDGDVDSDVKAPPFIAPSLYPNLTKVVSLDAFARFLVGNFRASLKNDGSVIWLKWEDTLFGVIDHATGAFRPLRKGLTDAAHKMAVHALNEIERDPRAAASADGILTGRCSCCSRPLTDPASIEIGIGPICLEKAGW